MRIAIATMAAAICIALPGTVGAESHRVCVVYENLVAWDASARFYGSDAGEDHADSGDPIERIDAQQEPRDAPIDRQPQDEGLGRERRGQDEGEYEMQVRKRGIVPEH